MKRIALMLIPALICGIVFTSFNPRETNFVVDLNSQEGFGPFTPGQLIVGPSRDSLIYTNVPEDIDEYVIRNRILEPGQNVLFLIGIDIKDLIENKDKIINDRKILLEAEKLMKAQHDYFMSDISVENYKKTFHIYHLATETTGKNVWKYHEINFAKKSNCETLISDFVTINAEGISVPNRVHARKIGEHFMMIIKHTEGNEPPAICIFPFAYRIEDINYGFIFGTSWVRRPFQGKMIISKKQIIPKVCSEDIKEGILSDRQNEFLEGSWKEGFTLKLLNFRIK